MIPCNTLKYCEICGKTYRSGKNVHKCAPIRCKHCGEKRESDVHECFIQPITIEPPTDKYIFYDFETRYHNGKHEANYVCTMDMSGDKFCFNTSNCVNTLVTHYRRPKYQGYTFVAHNASGFDNYILLEYFVKHGVAPSVTMRGSRVILMYDKVFHQRWIDSFSFLPMRLANTPSAMGFKDLEKGYFPHRFNTRENENYVGHYPDPSYYGYSGMNECEKEKFMAWYNTVRDEKFDFQLEMQRYCLNDVAVLRKAVMVYRDTFLQYTQLDPFAFTTLPSTCMAVFKALFLPRDTVALTYDGCYTAQNKCYSDASIQWLVYVAHSENRAIKHALRGGGEQQIGPYFADGYDAATHTCYEYNSCFYHGHTCYVQSDVNPVTKTTYGDLYRTFNEKVDALSSRYGMHVVVMWECEWKLLTKANPAVQAFLARYKTPERLEPRKALFGGRTNALKLYHNVVTEGSERILYFDFTSLYPYVQSRKAYPVGHPQIICGNFDRVENYFGLVQCTVLPPRGLYHPVLPYRSHNKLMFPLCRTCAEELNQTSQCTHSDHDRQLSGTWVTFELEKAIQKGYRVVCINEVWHFPDKTDTLFKGYVKTFLKCKQEASGYPPNVITADDQQKYIADYYEREGILLDQNKIRLNKAARSCMKYALNTLWGRFSLRSNLPCTELITEPERFTQLMFSEHYDVRQFGFISDDVAIVQWRHANSEAGRVKDVNVFIGAMTTAYARLMLYDLLDRLQQRVLYCDTDSVVFTARPGEWVPPTGPYLGDLTDELGGCGDYITEFVSGGPKCYAYHTHQGKTQIKCKGVTLNPTNAKTVTHESLKRLLDAFMVNQNTDTHLSAVSDTITRDKKHFHLKNRTVVKKVKVVYNKRRVLSDYATLPYGY